MTSRRLQRRYRGVYKKVAAAFCRVGLMAGVP